MIDLDNVKVIGGIQPIKEYGTIDNGKFKVNWSNIQSQLIKLAGRYCDRYASDIVIDINSISYHMSEGKIAEGETDTWFFGFRECGVDGNSYIKCRNYEELERVYREVWRLTFLIEETSGTFTMVLERVRILSQSLVS